MSLYEQYLSAWSQACAVHAATGEHYARVVAAIQRGEVKLGQVYGNWKLESIWAAGPQAWRPRPVREYLVMGLQDAPVVEKPVLAGAESQLPHDLLATYASLYQLESDTSSAETAAYNTLVAAQLRGEIPLGLVEKNSSAVATGYAEATGRVRIYTLKPAVEAPKRRKA